MATWVFVATLSWLIVATIGFVASVLLAIAIWFAIEPAAIVALTAVAFPIAFAHGILTRTSSTVGVLASLYAFALADYVAAEIGPSTALIVLLWLGFASAMAARELSKSDWNSAGR